MTKIMRDVHIKAPVEKVFDFLADPANLPELVPDFLKIENPRASVLGGHDYDWVYKTSDTQLAGTLEVIEFLTNRQIVTKSTKDIEGVFTWNFDSPSDDDTHLTLEIEYEAPASLLNEHDEKAIAEELDALLKNVKSEIESEVAYSR